MSIRSMMLALVIGVGAGAAGCVAEDGAPEDKTASVSQNITNTSCHNRPGHKVRCTGIALLNLLAFIDISHVRILSDNELNILEEGLNVVANTGDILTILSNNELKVMDILSDFDIIVKDNDINACVLNVLNKQICT